VSESLKPLQTICQNGLNKYPEYAKYVKYVEYGKYVQYTEYVKYDTYVEYAKYEIPIGISTPLLHMNPPCFSITNMSQICKICAEYEPPLFLYAKKYKI
jgi:hypothetical protein